MCPKLIIDCDNPNHIKFRNQKKQWDNSTREEKVQILKERRKAKRSTDKILNQKWQAPPPKNASSSSVSASLIHVGHTKQCWNHIEDSYNGTLYILIEMLRKEDEERGILFLKPRARKDQV